MITHASIRGAFNPLILLSHLYKKGNKIQENRTE